MAKRKLRGIQFDNPNEQEVFHAKESWIPLILGSIPYIVVGIVALILAWRVFANATVGLILFGISLALAIATRIPRVLANLDTDVVVTDKRLYVRTGIVDIQDQVCDISNISDVTIDPSVFGRVFDYANVRIQTYAGESDVELRDIAHAYDMRVAISKGADESKEPRKRPARRGERA